MTLRIRSRAPRHGARAQSAATGGRLEAGVSVLIFAAVIAVITVAHLGLKLGAVLAFWLAYITTRPLGASIGDLLSQSRHDGGLGLGTTGTSLIFLAVILALVVFLTVTRRDVTEVRRGTAETPEI